MKFLFIFLQKVVNGAAGQRHNRPFWTTLALAL